MRIVFNTYPVAFQCPGGGEIQLLKTMEALGQKGVEAIPFNPWETRLEETDIVHYFSVQGGSMNFCGYVHNQGIPLVISPIIWLGDTPEIYPVAEIQELLNISDVICPNSNIEARQLSEYFNIPANKFCVTHNGIDNIFTEPVSPDLFKDTYSIEKPFILCVGNIEPRKNQLKLIEALKDLDILLILIGNIRDQSYFEKCENNFNQNVRFIKYIDHDNPLLRSAYSACDLFVLPSLLETPGLAALEAIASGAKIVITEVGATKEYFGSNAYYVDPTDASNIKEQIVKALTSPPSMHSNHVYLWEKTADELIEAYNSILAQRKK